MNTLTRMVNIPVPGVTSPWRPARTQMGRPAARLGDLGRAADLLSSLITGGAVATAGLAAFKILGSTSVKPKPTWQAIGLITAGLGVLKVVIDVSMLAAPVEVQVPAPAAQNARQSGRTAMSATRMQGAPVPTRWRPDNAMMAGAVWKPSAAPSSATLARRPRAVMAQTQPMSAVQVLESGVSMTASIFGAISGFGLAFAAPASEDTWRWVGGIIGSISTLRLLHDVAKVA